MTEHSPLIVGTEELDSALASADRVYLAGHLEVPQTLLPHIDCAPEMGVSSYRNFTADKPHVHPCNIEFNYIAKGCTKLLVLQTGEEYELGAGSTFILPPGTPYATKSRAGTRVIFFKSPGGNDKQLVEVSRELAQWLSSWDAVYEVRP